MSMIYSLRIEGIEWETEGLSVETIESLPKNEFYSSNISNTNKCFISILNNLIKSNEGIARMLKCDVFLIRDSNTSKKCKYVMCYDFSKTNPFQKVLNSTFKNDY